jgi:RHS repeat-associated protein
MEKIPAKLHRAGTRRSGRYKEGGIRAPVTTIPDETHSFIGERLDRDSGLMFLNARYYDPDLCMFTQPDWWEVTHPGVGTNRYAYSGNDPVNWADPKGNCPICAVGLLAWGIVEVGLTLYDVYDVTTTALDPDATTSQKALSAGGLVLGAFLPGGGYSSGDNIAGSASRMIPGRRGADAISRSRITGRVEKVNESMSDRARSYQARVTGMEPGTAFVQNGSSSMVLMPHRVHFLKRNTAWTSWSIPQPASSKIGRG